MSGAGFPFRTSSPTTLTAKSSGQPALQKVLSVVDIVSRIGEVLSRSKSRWMYGRLFDFREILKQSSCTVHTKLTNGRMT